MRQNLSLVWRRMGHNLWLGLLLAAAAVFGLGGALLLSLKGAGALRYQEQWVEALLQVGMIATFGIVTTQVLERFRDTVQQRRDESKLRFDVLTELGRAYNDVKLERRKLQAGSPFSEGVADRLNQIQVDIELHKRNSIRLFQQGDELKRALYEMEHYLNRVANKATSEERAAFRNSEGFKGFSDPYDKAASLILNEIAGGRDERKAQIGVDQRKVALPK